jgi:type I restriction enzyme S subunit
MVKVSTMDMIRLEDAVTKGSSNISLNKVKDDEGTYPLYSAKGFYKNISFYHQEEEYLAIIKDGAGIGRVSIHPPQSSCVGTMQYLIPKEGFDIRFIKYCLLSIDFTKYSQGATIPHIYFKDYKSELIPNLSIEEQRKLVIKLDQAVNVINQAIENTVKNIKNLKELKMSILEETFKI